MRSSVKQRVLGQLHMDACPPPTYFPHLPGGILVPRTLSQASFLWIGLGQARDTPHPTPNSSLLFLPNCWVLLPANVAQKRLGGDSYPDFPFCLSFRSDAPVSPLCSEPSFSQQA